MIPPVALSASLYPALAQVHPTLAPDVFARWLEMPAFRNEVLGLFAERMPDELGTGREQIQIVNGAALRDFCHRHADESRA